MSQVYVLLGLLSIVGCLIFVSGYYVGRHAPMTVRPESDALVPEDVERETVALLLARAEDDAAERADRAEVELEFHDVLARRREAPSPTPRPTPEPKVTPTPEPKVTPTPSPAHRRGAEALTPAGPREAGLPSTAPAAAPGSTPMPLPIAEIRGVAPSTPVTQRETSPPAGSSRTVPATRSEETPASAPADSPSERVGRTGGVSVPKVPAGEKGDARYTVQVSSFKDPAAADRLVQQLKARGFDAYRVSADIGGVTWYRVRVGFFEGKEQAQAEEARLVQARPDLKPMITRE